MKIKYGYITNSSSDFYTLPEPRKCPKCGFDNIENKGYRYDEINNKLYEDYICKRCITEWTNEFDFKEQRINYSQNSIKRLVIILTNGQRDACGDAEMVSRMIAGEDREELEAEYEHKMPEFYFEE